MCGRGGMNVSVLGGGEAAAGGMRSESDAGTQTQRDSATQPQEGRGAPIGFIWGPLNSLFMGLGLAALTVGYIALSKGSLTLAPCYCRWGTAS